MTIRIGAEMPGRLRTIKAVSDSTASITAAPDTIGMTPARVDPAAYSSSPYAVTPAVPTAKVSAAENSALLGKAKARMLDFAEIPNVVTARNCGNSVTAEFA